MAPIAWKDLQGEAKAAWMTEFLQRAPYPPQTYQGNWAGAWPLGEGGQGAAGLWVRLDSFQRVQDRVVVKESQFDQAQFDNPDNYYLDQPGADDARQIPREVFTQSISLTPLENIAPSGIAREHIVRLRSWHTTNRLTWRIYSEFCDSGSLNDLIETHRRRYKGFDESLLWYVLESLAIAAQSMQRVPGLDPGRHDPPRTHVVHQDIKPENVFLAVPSQHRFRHYPVVKLGDFGAARVVHPQESLDDNPRRYMGDVHTPGYEPPELWSGFNFTQGLQYRARTLAQSVGETVAEDPDAEDPREDDEYGTRLDELHAWYRRRRAINRPLNTDPASFPQPQRIQSPANIWGIGMVILNMMRLRTAEKTMQIPYAMVKRDHKRDWLIGQDPWVPTIRPGRMARIYSAELRNLVHRCLGPDPGTRPTPTELYNACRTHINTFYTADRDRPRNNPYLPYDPKRLLAATGETHPTYAIGQSPQLP